MARNLGNTIEKVTGGVICKIIVLSGKTAKTKFITPL